MPDQGYQVTDLPPMPQVVSKIIQIDENNITLSSDQLQSLIAVDPALTSKILRIANSAFYARYRKVANLSEAVTLLGFKTIKSLTLLVSTSGLFKKTSKNIFVLKELWMRSVLTALIGKIVAEKTGHNALKDEVFMAGLLKNIGQLFMQNKYPEQYGILFKSCSYGSDIAALLELEQREFRITSPEVSAMAMQQWNFPDTLVHVSRFRFDQMDIIKEQKDLWPLVVPVLIGEIIVLYTDFTGHSKMTDEKKEKIKLLFYEYANMIQMKKMTQEYFLDGLQETIHQDEFYSFCEELFLM